MGAWTPKEKELHISVLEIKVVQLAINTFRDRAIGEHLILMSHIISGGSCNK